MRLPDEVGESLGLGETVEDQEGVRVQLVVGETLKLRVCVKVGLSVGEDPAVMVSVIEGVGLTVGLGVKVGEMV